MNGMEGTMSEGLGASTTSSSLHDDKSVRSEVDSLKEDLARIREDLASLASTMKDEARSRAYQARDQAQARVQENMDAFEQIVEERPLTTVLVAFGVGLVLGTIFSR